MILIEKSDYVLSSFCYKIIMLLQVISRFLHVNLLKTHNLISHLEFKYYSNIGTNRSNSCTSVKIVLFLDIV